MNGRIYRLPFGSGFYIVLEGKKAFLFDEESSFEDAIIASKDNLKNQWEAFCEDFSHWGVEGFAFNASFKL